jgi:beta-phosphoglucomutase-like phosphatase (HAD superfamily)
MALDLGALTGPELITDLLKRFGIERNSELALREFVETIASLPAEQLRSTIRPGIPEFLDFLASRGVTVIVLSGTPSTILKTLVQMLELQNNFYSVLSLEEYPNYPKVDVIREVVQRARRSNEACVIIDDSLTFLKSAIRLDPATAVPIGFGERLYTESQRHGLTNSYLVPNIDQLKSEITKIVRERFGINL